MSKTKHISKSEKPITLPPDFGVPKLVRDDRVHILDLDWGENPTRILWESFPMMCGEVLPNTCDRSRFVAMFDYYEDEETSKELTHTEIFDALKKVLTCNGCIMAVKGYLRSRGERDAELIKESERDAEEERRRTSGLAPGFWVALCLHPGTAPRRSYAGKVEAIDERGVRVALLDLVTRAPSGTHFFAPWASIASSLVAPPRVLKTGLPDLDVELLFSDEAER